MYGARRNPLIDFDLPLLVAAMAACALGLAMISSAVRNTPGLEREVTRQAIYMAAGLVLVVVVSTLDYRLIVGSSIIWYGLGIASLLVVSIVGARLHGGQRWLEVGAFSLQPSEFMKLFLILALSQYLGNRGTGPWLFRYLLVSALILALPVVLVYSQPDLGTALVLVAVWGMLVFLAGVRLREVAALLGCVAVALPLVWANLHGYMRDRVLGFVRPGSDPEISYVMDQALISIGSGAIWGKGYASGSQSQLHFLRVRHTDFIFSVIGEELGFVGAVLTLGLLAFICYRIFRIGQTAPDTCGRLVACGVGTVLAFQTLVNAGMNTGLLPVTGLPLPFISRGGSALLAQLIGIGLVESVALRRRLPHV